MTFAPATIAPMEYLHAKPKIKCIYKQNSYPNPNRQIKQNLKPYHNPNRNPNFLEKLRPEQLSPEQMSCHLMDTHIIPKIYTGQDPATLDEGNFAVRPNTCPL